jgi:hypothetical protein
MEVTSTHSTLNLHNAFTERSKATSMTAEIIVVLTALSIYLAGAISPGPSFTLIVRLAASGARPAAFGATVGFSLGAAT